MREGRVSAEAGEIPLRLRRSVLAYQPRTDGESDLYAQELTLVAELEEGGPSGCWRSRRASRPSCGSS